MVFLILSRQGIDEFKKIVNYRTIPVWVSSGILSPDECRSMREDQINLTVLSHQINLADIQSIEPELATISEHHPSEVIWIEGKYNS